MINTPPSQRPHPAPSAPPSRRGPSDASDRDLYGADVSAPTTPRTIEDAHPAAANAAVALAQLHHNSLAPEWESEADAFSEPEIRRESMRSSVELPSIRDQFRQNQLPSLYAGRARDLLPSALSSSPPGARSSTLPPLQRKDKSSRPRKPSVGQNARKPKHERNKSKEFARRLSMDGRKAMSAEPASYHAQGKRWEDLIEAATSATEAEDDRDLTPVSDFRIRVLRDDPDPTITFPRVGQYTSAFRDPSLITATVQKFRTLSATVLHRITPAECPDTAATRSSSL
ncbi:MAG: hypothetical protein Q9160_007069 [Pyrenula sp. 1 TL-2023]